LNAFVAQPADLRQTTHPIKQFEIEFEIEIELSFAIVSVKPTV
jgi:hypothetical protein